MANLSVTKLQALLNLLPAELKVPILAETIRQAELLRGSMIVKVPVGGADDPHRGALRDSIRIEKGRTEMRVLVRAGGPKTTRGGYDYAIAQEFGTEKMHAQPFFWSSYRARKTTIRRALKAAAKKAIEDNWQD